MSGLVVLRSMLQIIPVNGLIDSKCEKGKQDCGEAVNVKKKRHYSVYITWILLLLCMIAGLKTGIEESVSDVHKKEEGISIQSRLEELFKIGENKDESAQNTDGENQTEPDGTIENSDKIRVLIMTDGYQEIVHKEAILSSDQGLVIRSISSERPENSAGLEQTEEIPGNQEVRIAADDGRFQNGTIKIEAGNNAEITIKNLQRGYGTPSYAGALELYRTSEGVVIVNELPVEDYLCKVVPSEMPAAYQKEALKAQAVCARNYARRQMEDYAYPEYQAHVNDSTDFQVYNNSASQESASEAVQETKGQLVKYQGQIVTTYYYSTSCGKTTTMEAWGDADSPENAYLQSVEVKDQDGDYEAQIPWYRWEADISADVLSKLICVNTKTDIGTLQNLEITKKGPGDVVLQIKATGDKGAVTVDTENKIRRALGGEGYEICRQDGKKVKSSALLPSAFFTIEKKENVYTIKGGGYGHGVGMSQNGANEMAKKGKNYQEILQTFYPGTVIE